MPDSQKPRILKRFLEDRSDPAGTPAGAAIVSSTLSEVLPDSITNESLNSDVNILQGNVFFSGLACTHQFS